MTCSQCHFQFCWLCRDPWSTHNDHFRCSKYNEGQLQNRPEFRDGDQNELQVAQFYDQHYLYYYELHKHYDNTSQYEEDVKKKKLIF